MSDSNLVTTAKRTGGTSFDTPTCIGGKCEYPLLESDNSAKVYYHNMVCTQSKYERLSFNETMTTATGKPARSPFDDDVDAFYVGDYSISSKGDGLISFQRVFATIPDQHIEPYGLYSRLLPSYTVSGFTANNTDFESLTVKEQYSTDGATWVDRTTASLGDNKVMGSTIDGDSNVTVNDATLDWTNYAYVRLNWVATYTGSVATISDGSTIELNGNFDIANVSFGGYTNVGSSLTDEKAKVFLQNKERVNYYNVHTVVRALPRVSHFSNTRLETQPDLYMHSSIDLGDLIVESTSGTVGSKVITANTAPYNLSQWHAETNRKDFKGIYIGAMYHLNSLSYSGSGRVWTYFHDTPQNNDDDNTTFNVPEFSRSSTTEENCPAHIVYDYVKTDQPESIALETREVFPNNLDSTTSPTADQYLASRLNLEYINAENQFIERYMGNIYRLGKIRTTVL